MTNYQVRLLCYAIITAAGAIAKAIAASGTEPAGGMVATPSRIDQAMGAGTFLMIFGIFLFFLETFALSRKKKD